EIVIPKLKKKFSVRELLDGVEELGTRLARRERELFGKSLPSRIPEMIQAKPLPPALEPKNRPLGSLMSLVFGFIVLLAAIVTAAIAISKWVSMTAGVMTGVIIIGALLAIGV